MAASASSGLKDLYEELGDRVRFVTIYVREAHPGERVSQPKTFEAKMAHALWYARRDQIPWPVAVDDLEGTIHRLLGRLPDAGFIVDSEGTIAARVLWSNDWRGLRSALLAILAGKQPVRATRNASIVPLLRGAGMTHEVLKRAGPSAGRDMLVTAPPIYGLARIAALFRPLPPLARGVAALTISSFLLFWASKAIKRRHSR
jgi:hypothetical protein